MKYRDILLVDDDDDDHEIFTTAVNQINNEINCCIINNAAEALQKLLLNEINPQAIFLDLNMPGMNGRQFLEEIKKNPTLQSIPVIIFSILGHLPTLQLMKEFGGTEFYYKTWQVQ